MIRFAKIAFSTVVLLSALAAGPALANPKSSAAKGADAKDVLAACDRIAEGGGKCNYGMDSGGNISGCSEHACFVCFHSDKKCFGG